MPAHPAYVYFMCALLLIPVKKITRKLLLLIPPCAALYLAYVSFDGGIKTVSSFLGGRLWSMMRWDPLSTLMVYAFALVTLFANLYTLDDESGRIGPASLLYAGSALGVILAADPVVFCIFWLLMSAGSVLLVWKTAEGSQRGVVFRHLVLQATALVFLVAALGIHGRPHGHFRDWSHGVPGFFLFMCFSIQAALFPLQSGLIDVLRADRSRAGIYLSIISVHTSVYAFLRFFSGHPLLFWIGAASIIFCTLFSLIEDNLRAVLGYQVLAQAGAALCTSALPYSHSSAAAAFHAAANAVSLGFAAMFFRFLSEQSGCRLFSELRFGSYRTRLIMLLSATVLFSTAGLPPFLGYLPRVFVFHSAREAGAPFTAFLFLMAAAGSFLALGAKVFFTALRADQQAAGLRHDIRRNQILALCVAATACLVTGLFPENLFPLVPGLQNLSVYTPWNSLRTLEMATGGGLALCLMLSFYNKRYFRSPFCNVDTGLQYRKMLASAARWGLFPFTRDPSASTKAVDRLTRLLHAPILARAQSSALSPLDYSFLWNIAALIALGLLAAAAGHF